MDRKGFIKKVAGMDRKTFFRKVVDHLNLYFTKYVERNLFGGYKCWLNPLETFYLNFRCLPFRQAIKFPVFVYGFLRITSLNGRIRCEGCCKTGMVKMNYRTYGSPSGSGGVTTLNLSGLIVFHGRCVIGIANTLNIGKKAVLEMGHATKIMSNCNITAYQRISIGERSRIAHRCQVIDTNNHFIADFKHGCVKRIARPISIGTYCWICNSTTVTGGAVIPDKTIVSNNSLCNRDYSDIPPESIIGGQPAKLLSTGYRRVESRKLEREIQRYFAAHPEAKVYPLPEGIDHNCCDADSWWSFRE